MIRVREVQTQNSNHLLRIQAERTSNDVLLRADCDFVVYESGGFHNRLAQTD